MDTGLAQLDPDTMHNLAITIGQAALQPSPIAQAAHPAAPGAPPTDPVALPGQQPDLSVFHGAQPAVKGPRGTLDADKAERTRMLSTGAGEDQIYGKVTNSGFGQAHPLLGKILGGLGQGVAKLGDIGLSAVAPALAINLPGTEYHHAMQLHQLNGQIGNEKKEGQEEATTAETQARVPLMQAQTQEAQTHAAEEPALDQAQIAEHNAQTAALLHPQAKTDFEAWQQQNPGKPIEEWLKAMSANKTVQPKEQLQQRLLDAQAKGDTAGAKQIQQQLKDIDPMGEQRVVIQQQNAAANQSKSSNAATDKEFGYYRAKWDKDLGTYNTQNEKLAEASDLIGKGAMGAALGSVKSLSGLAGGQGSGVRITQAELNSIAQARGMGGDFEAAMQKFGDGNKLTPEQVGALKGIISDVQRVAAAKEAVINQGLDDLSNATDTKTIRKIDSQLRHVLTGGQ